MGVDQLLYTWANVGLEGRGRFQVVAASPGLHPDGGRRLALALKLCRYQLPASRPADGNHAVSYGWIDGSGWRFAFCRRYLELDAVSRPGNFAAHILVGRSHELPGSRLLELYDSQSWWSGDLDVAAAAGARLEPTELDRWLPGRTPDATAAQAAALLSALLAPDGQKLQLAEEAEVLVGALGRATRLLPELLETTSFSSYEGPDTAPQFRMVGVNPRAGHRGGASLAALAVNPRLGAEYRAASWVVDADASGHARTIQAAWSAYAAGGRPREKFIRWAALRAALDQGQEPHVDDLVLTLEHQDTAVDVLDYDIVLTALCREVAGGNRRARSALATASWWLDEQTGHRVGERLAAFVDFSPRSVEALGRMTDWPPAVNQPLCDAALATAEARPELFRHWPADLVAALIEATQKPGSNAELLDALDAAGSRHLLALSGDPRVPPARWARLALRAVESGGLPASRLTQLVVHAPYLLDVSLAALPEDRAVEVVTAMSPREALWALGQLDLARRDAQKLAAVTRAALEAQPPDERLRAAVEVLQPRTARRHGVWAPLIQNLLMAAVARELRDVRRRLDVETAADLASGLPTSDPLTGFFRYTVTPRQAKLRDALADVEEPTRTTLGRYALDLCTGAAKSYGGVDDAFLLFSPLTGYSHAQLASAVLRSGLRAELTGGHPETAVWALHVVALRLAAQGLIPVGGRPKNQDEDSLQRYAVQLVGMLKNDSRITRFEGLLELDGAAQWLMDIGVGKRGFGRSLGTSLGLR